MRRSGLVLAVALSACFAEPPTAGSGGSSGDEPTAGTTAASGDTTALSVTDSTDETADTSSTSFWTGTTFGDTTFGDSTFGDSTGDPVPQPFCETRSGRGLLACRDFESRRSDGWSSYETDGFMRTENAMKPLAHSAPHFAHIVRGGEVNGAAAQALFGSEFSASGFGGASAQLEVRFPLAYEKLCGQEPIRLFEIRFNASDLVNTVVVEASPTELTVYHFSPEFNAQIAQFDVVTPPPPGGWLHFDLELMFGGVEQDASFSVAGDVDAPGTASGVDFAPGDSVVSVNVGPWFRTDEAPADGCGYDLDDLLLEGIDEG